MITIHATEDEADLTGSSEELQQLRATIEHFIGSSNSSLSVQADAATDPHPYKWSLQELRILRGGDKTKVWIKDQKALVICASDQNLMNFRSWLDFASDAKPGSHNHLEAVPDDDYVAADSLPLVISVSSEGPTNASTRRAKTHARDA